MLYISVIASAAFETVLCFLINDSAVFMRCACSACVDFIIGHIHTTPYDTLSNLFSAYIFDDVFKLKVTFCVRGANGPP